MADEQKPAADEDKSINELLQEYAEDVKDKDLDDFLKNSDEDEEEDAFADDADDEDADKALVDEQPAKKSGGMLSMLMIIVAFLAAGAGAYIYMNKDEGMTAIMGGFMGNDEPVESAMPAAPTPDSAPTMLPAPTDEPMAAMDGTPQPSPIVNEDAPNADTPVETLQPLTDAPFPAPGADIVATPNADNTAPAMDPTVATADAEKAVDKWMSGGDSGIPDEVIAGTTPALPEKSIGELNAKPPVTAKKTAKKEAPKAEPKKVVEAKAPAAPKSDAQEAVAEIKQAEPETKVTGVTKKKAATLSPADDALPPPFVAIQSKKGGSGSVAMAAPSKTTLSVDTVADAPVLAKPTPASNAKMAPIVEGGASASRVSDGAKHSASGTGRDLEGNRNQNVSDVTSATGETAAMVAKGGGMTEIPSQGVPAPVGMLPTRRAIPAPAPELRTYKLAIQGGKSLPPGSQTRAYAQIPDTTTGTKPAMATSSNPTPPAVPVEPVETMSAPEPEPEVISPRVEAAPRASAPAEPAASSSNTQDASAIVRAAQQAESAGRAGDALELYQRALEVDAVYGGGSSIDRGAVYDRIGAIRAGQ